MPYLLSELASPSFSLFSHIAHHALDAPENRCVISISIMNRQLREIITGWYLLDVFGPEYNYKYRRYRWIHLRFSARLCHDTHVTPTQYACDTGLICMTPDGGGM